MFWIALAAAAQLSAPVPLNIGKWATSEDVPIQRLPEGHPYAVGFSLIVNPTGSVTGCRIDVTSGIPWLDSYTCDLAARRARFVAAARADGSKSYGVYESQMNWWIGSSGAPPPSSFTGDLDLIVNQLPTGVKSPLTVRVSFEVDAEGHISSCTAEKLKPEAAQLAKVACEQVLQGLKRTPVIGADGKTVVSIQDAQVRFSIK